VEAVREEEVKLREGAGFVVTDELLLYRSVSVQRPALQAGLTPSPNCSCDEPQTMSYIGFENCCPLTTFESVLTTVHEAEKDAVSWLNSLAITARIAWSVRLSVGLSPSKACKNG